MWRETDQRATGATPHVENAVGVVNVENGPEGVVFPAAERPRRWGAQPTGRVAAPSDRSETENRRDGADPPPTTAEGPDRHEQNGRRKGDPTESLAPVVHTEKVRRRRARVGHTVSSDPGRYVANGATAS